MRRLLLLTLTAVQAAACASAATAQEPARPRDYRKLVMVGVTTWLVPTVERGVMEISPLKPGDHYIGGDWLACLKTDARGSPRLWAVFFREDAIVHVRGALPPDRCQGEHFTPLQVAPARRR